MQVDSEVRLGYILGRACWEGFVLGALGFSGEGGLLRRLVGVGKWKQEVRGGNRFKALVGG